MKIRHLLYLTALFVVAVLLITGCHKKKIVKTQDIPRELAQPLHEVIQNDPGPNKISPTEIKKSILYFGMVHFDFDDARLTEKAKYVLYKNSLVLRANQSVSVNVEGHCDNRGTNSYNLALGERRARVIEQYYLSMGIERSRIGHVSYGEEIPYCIEDTEICWAQNRRGVTVEIP